MHDRKDNNRCGWYHHGNLLSRLYILSSHTDQLAASFDADGGQDAVDDITDWIHAQGYADYTVQGPLSALRVFAETVLDEEGDALPDTVGCKSFPGFTGPPGESPVNSYNRPYERFANIEPGVCVSLVSSPASGWSSPPRLRRSP